MTSQERRRLRALAPPADAALPLGGIERAMRLFDATSPELSDEERIQHVRAVLRMLADPRAVVIP